MPSRCPNRTASLLSVALIAGCAPATLSDLPSTAHEASQWRITDSTWIETLTVRASSTDILRAAEQALVAVGFDERRERWTDERRCGEYPMGCHEWPFS